MTRAALARPSRILATTLPSALAVTAVALTAALGLGLGPASAAATPKNVGLYGSSDPTYDGVFRQSLAILGLHAAGQTPDPTAIDWLLDQQCADGGFSSYNAAPAKGCPAYDSSTFTGGEDTNATSLALQALLVTGHTKQAADAAKVLRAAQDKDGGWPFIVGGGLSDPNSTGLVLSALAAAGDGVDADGAAYLAGLQIGCGTSAEPSDAGDRGGITTPYSNGAPDVLGTVQAIPGLAGLSLAAPLPPAGTWADGGPVFPCDASPGPSASPSGSASVSPSPSVSPSKAAASADDVAAWAATWLADQADGGDVTSANVGWAILSFASTHSHHDAAAALYGDLTAGLAKKAPARKALQRALAQSAESPGALGLGSLSAQTLGHHSTAVGYGNRIALTITASGASASPSPSATKSADPSASASASASATVSASASASGPQLPRTGGQPVLLVGGLLLLVGGTALVWLGARRRA